MIHGMCGDMTDDRQTCEKTRKTHAESRSELAADNK